jgi:hypothetical protein
VLFDSHSLLFMQSLVIFIFKLVFLVTCAVHSFTSGTGTNIKLKTHPGKWYLGLGVGSFMEQATWLG